MVNYSTLNNINTSIQGKLSENEQIILRSEQRDAITRAKEHFCKKVEGKEITNIPFFRSIANIYGMQKCVLVKPFAQCSSCEN